MFNLLSKGKTHAEIGASFGKSSDWVAYVRKSYDSATLKRIHPGNPRGRLKVAGVDDAEFLEDSVRGNRKQTLNILTAAVQKAGVSSSRSTVYRTLKSRGHKQTRAICDQPRPHHKSARVQWCKNALVIFQRGTRFFHSVIFTDEVRCALEGGKVMVNVRQHVKKFCS